MIKNQWGQNTVFSNISVNCVLTLVFLLLYIVNILFRFFSKTVRAILGPIFLILDKLTSPRSFVRSAQDLTDQQVPAAACLTGQP